MKLGRTTVQSDKAPKIHFISNACEEGRLDTQKLKPLSRDAGFSSTQNVGEADLILFFACGHFTLDEAWAMRIIEMINRKKNPQPNS